MKSSTDRNLNYRYKITNNPEDISPETFQRRLLKMRQSRSQQFIFDLTDITPHELSKYQSFLQKSTDPIFVKFSSELELNSFKNRTILIKIESAADLYQFRTNRKHSDLRIQLVFSPTHKTAAEELSEQQLKIETNSVQWEFQNYDSQTKKSLTVADVHSFMSRPHIKPTIIPFWNKDIPAHYELESLQKPTWEFRTPHKNIQISIIIPTYNNCMFLTNVVQHLLKQSMSHENYEVLIVDDGSSDFSQETIYSLIKTSHQSINIKYIYWSKKNEIRGDQNFFRAGLARNLGVEHSEGHKFMFLDSDMLVNEDFVRKCIDELEHNDIIQFSRLHIKQNDSQKNPRFHQINPDLQTYIEEENYWNQLFTTSDWNQMKDFWKYTCTYALGISRDDFYECGRFKRHFISYGFEDTDIGYRMAQKNKKFKLIQQHLLHLTNYSTMQYQNSKFLRDQLLRKTSKLLYLDHLDPQVYETFHFYYNFEKSLFHHIRDTF